MNEHARAQDLIPWKVNGRIEGRDAAWLEAHLAGCADCRRELGVQQQIRGALARESTVEFAPQAAFNRLWRRIEADRLDGPAPGPVETPIPDSGERAGRARRPAHARRLRATTWLRAALAVQTAVMAVMAIALWRSAPPDSYHTVTDPPAGPVVDRPVVKAVFDDQVRLADVKEILAASGLVVASGPSEAGVYTLVPRDARLAEIPQAALTRLRADPRVRFAERGAR